MEQINHLRSVLVRLPERDQSFASDLIRQHNERGLSPKQVYWVGKLIERATQPAPKPVKIGSLSAISGLFSKAKGRLKKPAIVLLCDFDHGAAEIKIAFAGGNTRYPGALHISSPIYGGQYYGRITREGSFVKSFKFDGDEAPLVSLLTEFAADPAGVAAKHGHLTGKCCFCNRGLTDDRSTDVGYGPVCADNYGLPWGAPKKPRRTKHHHEHEEGGLLL